MKLTTLQVLLGATSAAAQFPEGHPWVAPGPDDFRGPCPMLNTLANHGFLPHDGRDITKEVTVNAVASALNFEPALGEVLFENALVANPEPNATFFTLRTDAAFGNNHIFNQTVFDETRVYWTGPILDANMLANSKIARQLSSKAFNPNYTFTATMDAFSYGEVGAPVVAFGDVDAVTVNRTLVEYFFQNERLPSELGWSVRTDPVTLGDILRITQVLTNATSLITTAEPVISTRRRDLHAGIRLRNIIGRK
ncbi:hypothetical protein AAE478_004959 [Parahypoxylon ruwenzoriense]